LEKVSDRPVVAMGWDMPKLPKGGKTHEVPLPDSVGRRLKAHTETYPPLPVTLPWGSSTGEPRTVRLYLYTPIGAALNRPAFNARVRKPAIRATGIPDTRENGMHVLRHTYASVLLDAGESIKALAAYLGHADPGFTLKIYTHLLPTSEDRTRRGSTKQSRTTPTE
jgi:integrase